MLNKRHLNVKLSKLAVSPISPGVLISKTSSNLIIFFKTLSVRAGARGERLGLGAGIKAKHWAFDAALANHRWLGNIYRFTLTLEY